MHAILPWFSAVNVCVTGVHDSRKEVGERVRGTVRCVRPVACVPRAQSLYGVAVLRRLCTELLVLAVCGRDVQWGREGSSVPVFVA